MHTQLTLSSPSKLTNSFMSESSKPFLVNHRADLILFVDVCSFHRIYEHNVARVILKILHYGFSQLRRISDNVQYVVSNLECNSQIITKAVHCIYYFLGSAADQRHQKLKLLREASQSSVPQLQDNRLPRSWVALSRWIPEILP